MAAGFLPELKAAGSYIDPAAFSVWQRSRPMIIFLSEPFDAGERRNRAHCDHRCNFRLGRSTKTSA